MRDDDAVVQFDQTFDVVVAGSGGAALATAMGAQDSGLRTLVLESTDKWGGSTAMSGGGVWLPNNPLMTRAGAGDSRDEALTYMEETIGDVGAASNRARKEAFVDGIEDFVTTAERYGVRFQRAKDYPDYYPELPGGKIGRAIEVVPFDTKKIGDWWTSTRAMLPVPMTTDDFWLLQRAWSTPGGMVRGARFVFRTIGSGVTGRRLVGSGGGIASSLLHVAVVQQGAQLWLNAPMEDLIVQDGKVVGVRVTKDGHTLSIGASRGVMLAAGGFDHNTEWREKYHGIEGASSGNPGNVGGPMDAAMRIGAATELMDDAWWGGSTPAVGEVGPSFMVSERSMPFSLMVDAHGDRFANESESYVDLGHHMRERDPDGAFWMITDARHTHRYLRAFAMDPRQSKALKEAGFLVKSSSLAGLARKIDIDPTRLRATIDRFNGFAAAGVDGDFGRGNSAYDRYYGDPLVRPNPNLGPIERGPFTAVRVVAGDLGTKGGIVTDTEGRALREDGSVIDGLYAAGNCSASVMGRTYPGPGSTIGPAVVFGMRAARDMAKR